MTYQKDHEGHNVGLKEDSYGVEDMYCFTCNKWLERNPHNYLDHLEFFQKELILDNIKLRGELRYYKTPLIYRILTKIFVKVIKCFTQ